MAKKEKPQYAFTQKYGGRANVLSSKIRVFEAFDPQTTEESGVKSVDCTAIWDTGATSSFITKKIVNKFSLQPTGKETVRDTRGPQLRDTYFVNIKLPNRVGINMMRVIECDEISGGHEVLLGMDVIAMGDFAITNADGKTIFSFRTPSVKKTDYVAEIRSKRAGKKRKRGSLAIKKYKKRRSIEKKRKRLGRKKKK